MCDQWKKEWFNIQNNLIGNIKYTGTGNIKIEGNIKQKLGPNHVLAFIAGIHPKLEPHIPVPLYHL